jgi:ElaA protein
MSLTLTAKTFADLTLRELHDLMHLRVDVFVVEQRCIYPELDGLDPVALHILGHTDAGQLAAYARILPPQADGIPHLGRFVVHKDHRGKGWAHLLIERAIIEARKWTGIGDSAVAAQTHLEPLYEGHGFTRIGHDYDWDGIPHVDMVRHDP